MSEKYDRVSKNIINNLNNINLALENSKIESKVLTPSFTDKLKKLRSITNEKESQTNDSYGQSPSFNSSENTRNLTRNEINAAFASVRSLPREFATHKEKSMKKPVGKGISNVPASRAANLARTGSLQSFNEKSGKNPNTHTNLTRVGSLQNVNENSRTSSRSNSLTDITGDANPKIEELLQKINENKRMLEGIKSIPLRYPKTTNFGDERINLAIEFKKALIEITEMVNNLEVNVKSLDKEDVDLGLDEELNELLEQFTKNIKDYNFIQQNSTIKLDSNLNDYELEFPYSSLLNELKMFLERY